MKQFWHDFFASVQRQVREISIVVYPLVLYFVLSTLVLFVLEIFLGNTENYYVLYQALAVLCTVPFLRKMYFQDRLIRQVDDVKHYTPKQKWTCYMYGGLTILFLASGFNYLIGISHLEEISENYQAVSDAFYGSNLLLELVCLGIVVPFCEELLYRGVVYGRLRDVLEVHKAILFSALLFGIVHGNLVQFVYAFLVGIFLANFAERYQTYMPAFLGHAAANCVSILAQELGWNANLSEYTGLWILLIILLFGIGTFLYRLQYRVAYLK